MLNDSRLVLLDIDFIKFSGTDGRMMTELGNCHEGGNIYMNFKKQLELKIYECKNSHGCLGDKST